MKLKQLFAMCALFAMAAMFSLADDSMRGSTTVRPANKAMGNQPAVDRELEVRVGPRVSFLTGEIREGKTAAPTDIWGDLRFSAPNLGIQFNVDYQPKGLIDRLHVEFGGTYDRYDQSAITVVNLVNNKGTIALAGDTVKASGDIYTFNGKLGYDVVEIGGWYRLRPYIGGKAVGLNGLVTGSGNTQNGAVGITNKLNVGTRSYKNSYINGSYFGGIDQRFYITPLSRNWYFGVDAAASGWSDYYYLTGDVYSGYEFSKAWGVRIGYSADYIDYKNASGSTAGTPLLGAAYLQVVCGF